jgi:hypothetical protein
MSGHVLWVLTGVFAKSEHVQAGGGKKPAAASANASSWSTRPTARGKVVCGGGEGGGGDGGGDGGGGEGDKNFAQYIVLLQASGGEAGSGQ